jgi:ribonuclease Y
MHPEILKMLGRLKFRTSYGQNQLAHAVEVAKLSAVLAAELGADVEIARAGGLLHDLGKAMDHNTEGTHAQLGSEFARRYGVNSKVVNAMASHHHEVEQESIEAVIVEASDAISGAVRCPQRGFSSSTSSAYARWRKLPIPSRVSSSQMPSRQGVKYASWFNRKRSTILLLCAWLATLPKRSKKPCSIRQIKVTVLRETRAVEFANILIDKKMAACKKQAAIYFLNSEKI